VRWEGSGGGGERAPDGRHRQGGVDAIAAAAKGSTREAASGTAELAAGTGTAWASEAQCSAHEGSAGTPSPSGAVAGAAPCPPC
jgi:hypothetical protein